MALSIADILFYWDAALGRLPPIVGGQPTFSRAGNAFSRQIESAHHIELVTDTPRFEPDGLRLELAQSNVLTAPFDCFDGTGWAGSTFTHSDVTSTYEGEDGQKLTNTGSANQNRTQTKGTLTASPETLYMVVENIDSSDITLLTLRDLTVSDWVGQVKITWSTGVGAVEGVNVGSSASGGAIKLADVGPNGGPVYLVWITVTPDNSGNSRGIWIYPTGQSSNTDTVVIHCIQHVEAGLFTSPVEGTRVTELMYWSDPPPPQALIVYCKFKVGTKGDGGLSVPRIWAIEGSAGADPSFGGYLTGNDLNMFYDNNVDAQILAGITITAVPGDTIEMIGILNSGGSIREIARKNSGSVSANAVAAPASGLASTWSGSTIGLNSRTGGSTKGAATYQQLKIVKQANVVAALDGTGTGDEDLMAEMAGLYLSADGLRVSNTN